MNKYTNYARATGEGPTNIIESDLYLTDVLTYNATISRHGFLPKLSGSTSEYLRGDGTWDTITAQDYHSNGSYSGGGTVAVDINVVLATGTFTLDLVTAIGIEGKWYEIKNTGTGVITINPYGSQTIDGETTFTLYAKESISIVSDNANWWIL